MEDSAEESAMPGDRFSRGIAIAVVALDVLSPRIESLAAFRMDSPTLALGGIVTVLCINKQNAKGLGLCANPIDGWRVWIRRALAFSAAVGVMLAIYAGIWLAMGWSLPIYRTDPHSFPPRFFLMCVSAPICEEVLYRSLLIFAVLPTLGKSGAIVVSGAVFALIHVLGGNPSPENQFGGLLLAWAFVRGKTILVPLALHSGGNALVLIGQVATWYWSPESP